MTSLTGTNFLFVSTTFMFSHMILEVLPKRLLKQQCFVELNMKIFVSVSYLQWLKDKMEQLLLKFSNEGDVRMEISSNKKLNKYLELHVLAL